MGVPVRRAFDEQQTFTGAPNPPLAALRRVKPYGSYVATPEIIGRGRVANVDQTEGTLRRFATLPHLNAEASHSFPRVPIFE